MGVLQSEDQKVWRGVVLAVSEPGNARPTIAREASGGTCARSRSAAGRARESKRLSVARRATIIASTTARGPNSLGACARAHARRRSDRVGWPDVGGLPV